MSKNQVVQDIQNKHSSAQRTVPMESNDYSDMIKKGFGAVSDYIDSLRKGLGGSKGGTGSKSYKPLVEAMGEFNDRAQGSNWTESERTVKTQEFLENASERYSMSEIKQAAELTGADAYLNYHKDIIKEEQETVEQKATEEISFGEALVGPLASSEEKQQAARQAQVAAQDVGTVGSLYKNADPKNRAQLLFEADRALGKDLGNVVKIGYKQNLDPAQVAELKNALSERYTSMGLPPELVTSKINRAFKSWDKALETQGKDRERYAKQMQAMSDLQMNEKMVEFMNSSWPLHSTDPDQQGLSVTGAELMSLSKVSPDFATQLLVNTSGGDARNIVEALASGRSAPFDAKKTLSQLPVKDTAALSSAKMVQAAETIPDEESREKATDLTKGAVEKSIELIDKDVEVNGRDARQAVNATTKVWNNLVSGSTSDTLERWQNNGSAGEATTKMLNTLGKSANLAEDGAIPLFNPVTFQSSLYKYDEDGRLTSESVSDKQAAQTLGVVKNVQKMMGFKTLNEAARMYNRAMAANSTGFQKAMRSKGAASYEELDKMISGALVGNTSFSKIQPTPVADDYASQYRANPQKATQEQYEAYQKNREMNAKALPKEFNNVKISDIPDMVEKDPSLWSKLVNFFGFGEEEPAQEEDVNVEYLDLSKEAPARTEEASEEVVTESRSNDYVPGTMLNKVLTKPAKPAKAAEPAKPAAKEVKKAAEPGPIVQLSSKFNVDEVMDKISTQVLNQRVLSSGELQEVPEKYLATGSSPEERWNSPSDEPLIGEVDKSTEEPSKGTPKKIAPVPPMKPVDITPFELPSPVADKPSKVSDKELSWKVKPGTEVKSPVNGTVEASVEWKGTKIVIIQDKDKRLVCLQGVDNRDFKQGDVIKAGQVLGQVDRKGKLVMDYRGPNQGRKWPKPYNLKLKG